MTSYCNNNLENKLSSYINVGKFGILKTAFNIPDSVGLGLIRDSMKAVGEED